MEILINSMLVIRNIINNIFFRSVIKNASRVLRHAAGNLYINDKNTGSVVGQQPFGGSRQSGI